MKILHVFLFPCLSRITSVPILLDLISVLKFDST